MRYVATLAALGLLLAVTATAGATYYVKHDFETSWTGDWAPGWESEEYRHGAEPIAKMQQVDLTSYGRSGYGAKLYMFSVADSQWWGNVEISEIPGGALNTAYDPWVSVDMYDAGYTSGIDGIGQLYSLPSWVVDEDWTDVQFGGRTVAEDVYYYTWADRPHPAWQATTVQRPNLEESGAPAWHNFKIQLDSTDNMMHFYIDGTEVGTSTHADYTDLGGLQFSIMFDDPLSGWGDTPPSVIFYNFEYGSTLPEPVTIAGLMLGIGCLARYVRGRKA